MIERHQIENREQWLQLRSRDITASVVAGLFGVHPYTTSLRLYAQHRGVEFPEIDNKVLRRGRLLEPSIALAVGELHPEWEIEAPRIYLRDPDLKLGCTPDFFLHGDPRGLGILQAKSVAPHIFARDWNEGSEPPLWITLQAACEMMLCDAAFGVVAGLIVDPFNMDCHIIEIPRNPAAEQKIRTAVRAFWEMVAAGQEPAPDFDRDAAVIRAMRPHEATGKVIDLAGNNELPILLEQRAALSDRIKTDEARCKAIEAEIAHALGDAESATGLNGWHITFRTTNFKGYEVKPRSSRVLRIYDRRESEAK
jgi:YqaJ-like viral recombinase domain